MRCVMCMDPFDWRVCEWMLNQETVIYIIILRIEGVCNLLLSPIVGIKGVCVSSDSNFITINE